MKSSIRSTKVDLAKSLSAANEKRADEPMTVSTILSAVDCAHESSSEALQPPISVEAEAVRKALIAAGLETPMVENQLSKEEKQQAIETHMRGILTTLGMDLRDDSLLATPARVAKMYVQEVFSGLDYQNFPKITMIDNKMDADEMVRVKDIEVLSTCEHHLVTIDGLARIAYVPRDRIIGLSKLNRVARFFGQRPQVQERLNQQIFVALQTLLGTKDVAVAIEANHYCVKSRGVKDGSSSTATIATGGVFKTDPGKRQEFLTL